MSGSGSENAHFSLSRVAASARSSSSNSWVRLTLFVQLVRIQQVLTPSPCCAKIIVYAPGPPLPSGMRPGFCFSGFPPSRFAYSSPMVP